MCEHHAAGHGGCGEGHDRGHRHDAVAAPGEELVVCAVRGNKTVRSEAEREGRVRERDGRQYYFCCPHCVDLFDADPATYAAAV
ncbi:MAG TPA: YHS domain-containing protein [Propionicimonas sp.]|jgi:YHS domain-containing protein